MVEQESQGRVGVPMSTRRGFVGGLATGAAAQVAAGPLLTGIARAQPSAACTPTPRPVRTSSLAVAPDGRTVWTADAAGTTITSHRTRDLQRGRSIDVGGAPLDLVITPDGRIALVLTAAYDRPGVAIVDLRSGQTDHVDVGPEPYAITLSPDGRRAYVSGGGQHGTLTRIDHVTGKVHEPIELGAYVRGMALYANGTRALVAVGGESAVAVVDVKHARVLRRIATPQFPTRLAVAPDGRRALVTHNGFGARQVTPLDLSAGRARTPVTTGEDPAGVAFSRGGTVAMVANSGAGTVSVLRTSTWRHRRRVNVKGSPRHVAVVGRRGIAGDGASGRLTTIRLTGGR